MVFRVNERNHSHHNKALRAVASGLVALALLAASPRPASASADEVILDTVALTQLETRAAGAETREQCFLYAEVLHHLTEIAGKQLADGQEEQAAGTLQHINAISGKLQVAIARDAKRLKNAEMLMEHTAHRLSDMLHITSGDQHDALQSTLRRVDALHTQLLAQVFAK